MSDSTSNEVFTVVALPPPARGLRLTGDLDMGTVDDLNEALAGLGENGTVTLDLAELTFIDSSGLHAIIRYARSRQGGSPVTLTNPPEALLRLFDIAGLDGHPAIEVKLSVDGH
jgi:anti-anti-sigma factor